MGSAIRAEEVLGILRHILLVQPIPPREDPRWERLRSPVDRGPSLRDRFRAALIGGVKVSCHAGHLTERSVTEVRGYSHPISSLSWNEKTKSGRSGWERIRWEPAVSRFRRQPIRRRAARTWRALMDRYLVPMRV